MPKHPVQKHIHWERAILIRSSNKQSRDEKTRTKRLEKIEETLQKMRSGLNRRRLKTRKQVESKLDRLFAGHLAHYRRCIQITLDGPDGQMQLTWSWNPDALERLKARDGIYVLLTNRKDPEKYPPSWALETYKERNKVEQRMRDLKSSVKIRPLFVHTDERIQALVWITVVALQIYSLIEWEARKAQEEWTTRYLKKVFSSVSILQTLNPDGSIDIEWCNLMPAHINILKKLGLRLAELPDRLEPFT